jgi:hypothetical protein
MAFSAVANAGAQRGTADGLIALAHGDYNAAAAILKPIAEADTSSDVTAQFLMATLYEAGRGVSMDRLHACALYHRAANRHESVFGEQATHLMRSLWRAHDNEWFAKCQALANLGFDHRFEPVTFELGSGHSVEWHFAGATASYQGRVTEFPWRAARGAAFLPLQSTTLRTPGARHFIEMWVWEPSGREWALNWHVFEAVRDQVVHVAGADTLMTRATRPPPGEPDDPRALVVLSVNAAGQAEWSILAAGRERRGTIAPR